MNDITTSPVEDQKASAPLVSFLILTYNQASIIREAIAGALEQDYSPLEIIISDDCSSDGTYEKALALVARYDGPHQVTVRKNDQNLGIVKHFELVAGLCKGELITGNGGDDISLPQRSRISMETWLAHDRKPDLIACPVIDMDVDGSCHSEISVSDLSKYRSIGDWVASQPFIIGAGLAWSQRLLSTYHSPLPDGLGHEDQIGIVRCILGNGGITISTPLVKYRRGGVSQKPVLDTSEAISKKMLIDAKNDWLFLSRVVLEAGEKISAKDRQLLQKKIGRARHVLDMANAGPLQTALLTLHSTNADAGFRLRVLMHLRASWLIALLVRLKAKLRNKSGT